MNFNLEPMDSCWTEVTALMSIHFGSIGKSYRPSRSRYKEYEESGNLLIARTSITSCRNTGRDGMR
jgi:hypothetical protein